jgi:prevent-host-death family protein
MKKAGIAELRNNLSRYLDHVRAGGTVTICDRDTPVAQIVPIEHAKPRTRADDEARIARLERKGIIRRGKGDMLEWLRSRKLPRGRLKTSLVETLLEERESGW